MTKPDRNYLNPPIQEAICEIHFNQSEPLTLQKIESLKPIWSASYPDQKVVQERRVDFHLSPEGLQTKEGNLGHRLICKSADGKRLVQLSGLFIATNQLSPYPGWEELFRDTILERFEDLQKAIGPLKFKRVGLRYINRIDVPQVPLVWADWFKLTLPAPSLPGFKQREFQMQFHQELTEDRRFVINLAALPARDGKVSPVMLDLDLIWEGAPKEPGELRQVLEHVHGPHRLVFEAYLSNKLRKLFN
ncbi:MAG: TIGR04255 family protein [Candidatus Binatia bacterium]